MVRNHHRLFIKLAIFRLQNLRAYRRHLATRLPLFRLNLNRIGSHHVPHSRRSGSPPKSTPAIRRLARGSTCNADSCGINSAASQVLHTFANSYRSVAATLACQHGRCSCCPIRSGSKLLVVIFVALVRVRVPAAHRPHPGVASATARGCSGGTVCHTHRHFLVLLEGVLLRFGSSVLSGSPGCFDSGELIGISGTECRSVEPNPCLPPT